VACARTRALRLSACRSVPAHLAPRPPGPHAHAPARPASPDAQRVKATVKEASASAPLSSSCCVARHSRCCAPFDALRDVRVRWSQRGCTMRRSMHSYALHALALEPTLLGLLGLTNTTATSASSAGGSSCGAHTRCFCRRVADLRSGDGSGGGRGAS
jgi:hypothetical protein